MRRLPERMDFRFQRRVSVHTVQPRHGCDHDRLVSLRRVRPGIFPGVSTRGQHDMRCLPERMGNRVQRRVSVHYMCSGELPDQDRHVSLR